MQSVSPKQINKLVPDVLAIKFDSIKEKVELDFKEVLPPEIALHSSLVFVSDLNQLKQAKVNKVKGYILNEKLWSDSLFSLTEEALVWTTANIQMAMTNILPLFDKKSEHLKTGIHPTAVIHPDARVAPSAHIGAYSVIEAYAQVGENTILYPHVYIGAFCEVGSNCLIAPHTTIGADGFGFYSDKQYTHHKIPQIGKVIIEDNCEIGANCAVDRATLTETRIKKGSKLDNFCHIAHNVEIGENAMITAGFIVAGSTKIGKNFTTAGGVHVNGHIQICDNVVLSGRAGATSDIKEPGVYGGFPLEPHRESIKTLVSIPQIKVLRKQIKQILKHLNLTTED